MHFVPLEHHVVHGNSEVTVPGARRRLHVQEGEGDLEAVAGVSGREELQAVVLEVHRVDFPRPAGAGHGVVTDVHIAGAGERPPVGRRGGNRVVVGVGIGAGGVEAREAGLVSRQ